MEYLTFCHDSRLCVSSAASVAHKDARKRGLSTFPSSKTIKKPHLAPVVTVLVVVNNILRDDDVYFQ